MLQTQQKHHVSFQTESSLRECSKRLPITEVKRCSGSVWTARQKWPLLHQDGRPGYCVSAVRDRNRPGNTMSQDQLLMLPTGDGAASVIDKQINHQQTSCVQVFEHASNIHINIKERETLEKRAGKQSDAREYGIGVQSTPSVFAVRNGFCKRCQVSFPISHNDLNQEDVTALAHHRPQVCAVDEHFVPP